MCRIHRRQQCATNVLPCVQTVSHVVSVTTHRVMADGWPILPCRPNCGRLMRLTDQAAHTENNSSLLRSVLSKSQSCRYYETALI